MLPWSFTQRPKPATPHETMLERLRDGVPPELVARAAGISWSSVKDDPEIDKALAEGEILLFERARDSGVTGMKDKYLAPLRRLLADPVALEKRNVLIKAALNRPEVRAKQLSGLKRYHEARRMKALESTRCPLCR